MALNVGDESMSSDRSPHTARPAPGDNARWEVSWLPGRHLSRSEAVTAMTLADTTASGIRPGHRAWARVAGWATALGMTGTQALTQLEDPPRWATRHEKTAGPPRLDYSDLDPIERSGADEDWLEPDWGDPDFPGSGPGRPPRYMFNLAVSPWYKQHYPGNSANLRDALRAGRAPQSAPEPGKAADREAGQ